MQWSVFQHFSTKCLHNLWQGVHNFCVWLYVTQAHFTFEIQFFQLTNWFIFINTLKLVIRSMLCCKILFWPVPKLTMNIYFQQKPVGPTANNENTVIYNFFLQSFCYMRFSKISNPVKHPTKIQLLCCSISVFCSCFAHSFQEPSLWWDPSSSVLGHETVNKLPT